MRGPPSCIYWIQKSLLRVTNMIVWNVLLFFFFCIRAAKTLTRLCGCACVPKPLLVAYDIRTIIHELVPLAATRLCIMFLEKGDKRKHFGLLVISSTVHNGRRRKLSSTVEPKHDKINKLTVPSEADSNQPGHPPSLTDLCCPRGET